MRRNLLVILMLVLAVSLTACGTKADDNSTTAPETEETENVEVVDEDTPEEPQEEENVDEETNEEADEPADEEEVAENEESFTWPKDFMPNVPEFQGKIFKFTEKQDNVHIYIGFEDVTHEEAVNYVEELKEAGFTKDSNGYSSEGTVNYKGNDKDGNFVKFHWSQNGYGGVDMIKK